MIMRGRGTWHAVTFKNHFNVVRHVWWLSQWYIANILVQVNDNTIPAEKNVGSTRKEEKATIVWKTFFSMRLRQICKVKLRNEC